MLQVLFSGSAEVAAGLLNFRSAGARAGPHFFAQERGILELGAPGGREGLPGGAIGFHETIGTLLRALEVALRGYPGSKIRLSSALLTA